MVYITMQDALLHMYVLCEYSVKNKSPKSLQVVQAQSVCVCVCVCVCVVCVYVLCVCVRVCMTGMKFSKQMWESFIIHY